MAAVSSHEYDVLVHHTSMRIDGVILDKLTSKVSQLASGGPDPHSGKQQDRNDVAEEIASLARSLARLRTSDSNMRTRGVCPSLGYLAPTADELEGVTRIVCEHLDQA
jgi:hypothetical protein